MSKAYKVEAKVMNFGTYKGKTIYTVRPVSYGLLTTEEAARQISMECTATPADVKAVLDRYAYYVKENLRKGYDIELLGFGTLTLRFLISHSVTAIEQANAKMVKCLMPAFRPSYNIYNGTRVYDLIPEKVSLVKLGDEQLPADNTGEDAGEDIGEDSENPLG